MMTPPSRRVRHSACALLLITPLALLLFLSPLLGFTGVLSADEAPPAFLRELGTYGAAEALFFGPYDVAVDSDGHIYVADTYNHRLQMFDGADWITIGGDGEIGTAPGEFNQPRGVTVDADGTVYVADRENHRVQMFDGEEWTVIGGDGEIGSDPGEFYFPMGLALDATGTLYVTDGGNHRVQAYDGLSWTVFAGTTGVVGTTPGEFSFPLGIAIDPISGDMFVTDYDNNRVQHFDGTAWSIIGGGPGTDPGQFEGPVRVAVSPDGDVYVSDVKNHRVQMYDGASWSVFAGTTGVPGVGPGQFARPTGVAVDSDGCVYVAELDNNRIQVFDSSGTFLTMWAPGPEAGQFNQPWGVSVGVDGSVYVADRNNHRIQRLDGGTWSVIGGNGLSTRGVGQFSYPTGVAVDPTTGNVYVADTGNHRIQRYDGVSWTIVGGDEGVVGTDPGQFNGPRGITVHTDGSVYVADVANHRVQMFDGVDWTVIGGDGTAGTDIGKFNYPARVSLDSEGNIYVADTGNHRIQVFDGADWTVFAGTGSAGTEPGEFGSPTGVAVDDAGNLYVADRDNSRIQKFDSSGVFLTTWGTGGSGPGQFAAANDVALSPNGDIYVADTCPFEACNHRIQVFTYSPIATIALETGWNMVSVPLTIDPASNSPAQVFEGAVAVYTWNPVNKSYHTPPTIEPECGYWVAVTEDMTITVKGTDATDWIGGLTQGWNMVGSFHGRTVHRDDLADDPEGSVLKSAIYNWNPSSKSYDSVTLIEPGKGYWVATTADCILTATPPATAAQIHTDAWTAAADHCDVSEYYKYSLYSARSLAVAHPEVYLQADTLWMDMISTYGGWQSNYLQRNRGTPEDGWDPAIGTPINNALRDETANGTFDWNAIEWAQHRAATIDQYALYDDAFTFDWLDNRLLFIWSALKGEDWAMPQSSLAELMYLDMQRQDLSAYLLFQEDRNALVATVAGATITLYDPLTGDPIAEPYSDVVLVMNNDYVWYPLMGRDDTGSDPGLALIVDEFCTPGAVPALTSSEDSLIDDLAAGTVLDTEEEFAWATIFALRAVNQFTWRAGPLRQLSAVVFPERYAEDDDYSDTPAEQQALGMVVTEMGNRLSPVSAEWAAAIGTRSWDMDAAFEYMGDAYLARFHRDDAHSDWVNGDYYHCWQPNLEDKLISGLGNCVVEAGNTMAALTLAAVPNWDIFLTNWWKLGETGGHVICGAYSADGARSLSNGLFRTNDGACMHGPLWSINGIVGEQVIYDPSAGFLTFVQTTNAADFSPYASPFTNLSYTEATGFLQFLSGLESEALIVQRESGLTGVLIDDYLASLPDLAGDWPDNLFGWTWP